MGYIFSRANDSLRDFYEDAPPLVASEKRQIVKNIEFSGQ